MHTHYIMLIALCYISLPCHGLGVGALLRRGSLQQPKIGSFQTVSGQTGSSQKCRRFPIINVHGKTLIFVAPFVNTNKFVLTTSGSQ